MASDLDRAILAAREGNLTQMKFFYTRHLLQNPNDVKVWAEYLQLLLRMSNVSKDAGGIDPRVLSSLLAWKKPPLKTVEECLDTLFTAPNQLASLFKIGKAAQEAGWLETAVFMFSRVLALGDRLSPESMRTVKLEYRAELSCDPAIRRSPQGPGGVRTRHAIAPGPAADRQGPARTGGTEQN